MKGSKIFLLSLALFFLFAFVVFAQKTPLPSEISETPCDLNKPCPEGLECFYFPEIGLRCAQPNPCSYFRCPEDTKCSILQTYPPKIHCAPRKELPPAIAERPVSKIIDLDENIQPQDLNVSEPKLLPDSSFYFLKSWARKIQEIFTFNPLSKAKLRLKFANERLMELKKLIEANKDPEIIQKTTENYQQEIEKIKGEAEKIKEKAKENFQVESFLDKFIDQQILHQKLLDRLETQVTPQAFEKIKETRERHLENFKDVMLKLEDRGEKITEKLNKILGEQKGSEFKNFKNLEVLKNLEEKVPEEAKVAIRKAQENALKRLKEDLGKMSPSDQEKFKEYIEKISGAKEKHLEILENLRQEIQTIPAPPPQILELRGKLEESKERMLEKIEERLEKLNCPRWTPPAPEFCKEGRVIIEKDEKGCLLAPRCIIPGELEILELQPQEPVIGLPNPASVYCKKLGYKLEIRTNPDGSQYGACIFPDGSECEEWAFFRGECGVEYKKETERNEKPQFCITLWDPVCGKDNKTYSNECFAKMAGVEVNYKGECKKELGCAKEGEKVNRNPLLGPTDKKCCEGLVEVRVSRSYSICQKPEEKQTEKISPAPEFCIQVITAAKNPETGECREFPTPCDVPEGWIPLIGKGCD